MKTTEQCQHGYLTSAVKSAIQWIVVITIFLTSKNKTSSWLGMLIHLTNFRNVSSVSTSVSTTNANMEVVELLVHKEFVIHMSASFWKGQEYINLRQNFLNPMLEWSDVCQCKQ